MRSLLTRVGLVALGVLMLSGGSAPQQWPNGIVPDWALHQDAPIIMDHGSRALTASASENDCPPSVEFEVPVNDVAHHFDVDRRVTEIYANNANFTVTRWDIDSLLNVSSVELDIDFAHPWIAEDLDLDGDLELVTQWGDDLTIYSAPDWRLRSRFVWPGMNVVMNPALVNIDDDPYWEIYVTPHGLGGSARAVIIKYDPVGGDFVRIADIEAPYGAAGRPAVGDFDQDGRMEFISGSLSYGYRLYEWQETTLAYIGLVGDSLGFMNYSAVACRPKPGGVLHALLGHSGGIDGYHYQLLEPTGDNTFDVVHVFQEFTGASGLHPCWAADTDCDGLDELAMLFYPQDKVWEWDEALSEFTLGCVWPAAIYDPTHTWYTVDLDQNGAPEWGAVSSVFDFRAFPDLTCVLCDGYGTCPHHVNCSCVCHGDPLCDGQVDILDVVGSVDVAFRNGEPFPDPSQHCSRERTNVDCDGDTDVLDVVRLVNVAFRNGDPAVEFCDPCAP